MQKQIIIYLPVFFILFLLCFVSPLEVNSHESPHESEVEIIPNVGFESRTFNLVIQNISAGESPDLNILNATDQANNKLDGEYRIQILMEDKKEDIEVTFIDGYADYEWDKIIDAGRYETEVIIGNVSRVEDFYVKPGNVETIDIYPYDNKTIKAEERLDFSAEGRDKYGNLITENNSDFEWENATEGIFYEEIGGVYDVKASYLDVTSNTTRVTVKAPFFRIDITHSDEEVKKGETISVKYDVENWGENEATQNVEFKIEGELIDIKENLTLKPGERYEGEFRHTIEEEGQYEVRISTEDSEVVRIFTVHGEESRSIILMGILYVPVAFFFLPIVLVFGMGGYWIFFALHSLFYQKVKI